MPPLFLDFTDKLIIFSKTMQKKKYVKDKQKYY
jgi:hypothetical protein